MSLRIKMMLALLLTGLASVAVVGVFTYASVDRKFDTIRSRQAAEHFHTYMTAYLAEYGDWKTAISTESFDHFVQRTERRQAAPDGERPSELLERMPPNIDQQSRAARAGAQSGENGARREALREEQDGHRPEPAARRPESDERRGPPPDGRRPAFDERRGPPDGVRPEFDERRGPDDARPRGPGRTDDHDHERDRGGADGARQPPYRFVLTDADYTVLLGAGQYGRGTVLPMDARAQARPIEINGKVAAYVSTKGMVMPSRQELEFLGAMRSSLAAGAAGAALLALGLGLALSRGLSSRLSHLTSAVRAMHGGSLRQQVPVQGKDEVATLAGAFNEMSEQLARSHEELQASHQTILEQAEQLRELSIRDALTNLYNRRHFDEQANSLYNQAVRHKRPLSLVIGDIDFFKKINDNYSHAIGDAVLRQVGAILRQHVRLSDLVARYGGEEFVLALPETDLPQAAALCDKLRLLIEQHPWHEVAPGLKVTMSMGVFADYAAGNAEAMLQKADALLYQAKETGRNRVCHA